MTVETYEFLAGKPTIKKRTNEVLDYACNWADYLAQLGDVIASSNWTISGGLSQSASSFSASAASVTLSGGVSDVTETAINKITTSTGRVAERTIYLLIWNR